MKKKFRTWLHVIILASVTAFSASSQIITTCTITNSTCNYVTNGGFEDNNISEIVDYMPDGTPIYGCDLLHSTGTAYKCGNSALDQDNTFHGCNWTTAGWSYSSFGTADYYHACANTCWNTMSVNAFSNFTCNNISSISPHSGSGYAGIYVYTAADAFPGASASYKESIKQSLSTTLISGKTYVISMWVRLSHHSKYAVSDFWINGINFTTTPLTNKNGWTLLTTCYTPVTNVSQIEIGSYALTLTDLDPSNVWAPYGENSGQRNKVSYYYIDDVSITPLNVNAGSDITIYPGCGSAIGASTVTSFPCASAIFSNATISYNWLPNTNLSANNTAITIASPPTTTTYTVYATVTYTNATGAVSTCSSSDEVTVYVVTPTLTIIPSVTCNANSSHSFTVTVNPTPVTSYIWSIKDVLTNTIVPITGYGLSSASPTINFQNVTRDVYVCAVAVNSAGCQSAPQCYYFTNCCPTATNVIKYANTTYNTTIALASATGTNAIALGGTITVNSGGNLIITSKDVRMEPNTKIVLNGTGRITLNSDYIHGCDYMWDGIYANTTGLVSSQLVRFEDAKRVFIDSLGTVSLNIVTSYFNKNNMGIVIKAAKSPSSAVTIRNNLFTCSSIPKTGSVPYIPATANLANATILGAYPSVNMTAPYNTLKSYCGVYMANASHIGKPNSAITIGANTNGSENVFDKMQYGAFEYVSNMVFQNNVFQNIKSTIAPTAGGSNNAAVLVFGPLFGGGPYYTQIGGSTTAFKNTFKDNDYGVSNILQSALLVENNRFENQVTGIYVSVNNNGSAVSVGHNKFVNNKIGINFDQNSNIDATILENWMDNTSAQGTYADNFAIRCTESVPTTNPATNAKYYINNNYINGYYNGITTKLTYQSTITDNEVHMRPDITAYHFQSGIWIEASNTNLVTKNLVDMPSSNPLQWWQYGIFTAGSTTPKIRCNNINYLGVGIIANGLNYTTPGDGINGNSMSNNGYGFWLNAQGEIGDQYTTNTSTSADNSWTNCGTETFANQGCNNFNGGLGAKFYTRSTANYSILNPTRYDLSVPLLSGIVASNIASGACYNSLSTPTLNLRASGNNDKKLLIQNADEIANGSIVFADNNESLKQIARKQLYSNLALQQIDQNISPDINTFANNCKQNELNKFFLVDSLINTGDSSKLNLATVINNSINTTNSDVDATQQQFNTLYINYLKNNRKAKSSDVVDFENIAWLCPNINGHAVYQARSVLFNITKQQYVNGCEKGDANSSHRFASSVISNTTSSVKLFPNPSNGNMTLQTDDDLNYTITVYNLLGEIVFESSVSNKQSINLNNLSSATYIVHILNNGNLVKTERISIIH
jgi:hypothetical protein